MKMYDDKKAAEKLDCSVALLRRMRREGRGPRFTRIGRLVRYSDDWLLEYIQKNASSTGIDDR
jgi:hypothetical protein